MSAMFAKDEDVSLRHGVSAEGSDGQTLIGSSVVIEGEFNSQESLVVHGAVKGTITTTQDLQVGEHAKIEADVHANSAHVAGEIHGNLTVAESVTLTASAKIYGDIETKIISIDTGAIVNGRISTGTGQAAAADSKTDGN